MASSGNVYSKVFIICCFSSCFCNCHSGLLENLFLYLFLFFFSLFIAILKMKVSKLYSWKKSQSLDFRSESCEAKSGEKPWHSHLKSRGNQTGGTSEHEAKQRARASALTRPEIIPALQHIAFCCGPSETVHRGIFYLGAWRVLWATGCNCIHSQYKWLLEVCTSGNFACSLWVMTHFYSLRSGTAGKTTDPFLLATL